LKKPSDRKVVNGQWTPKGRATAETLDQFPGDKGPKRGRSMGKKEDAKLISEKAKDYFNQGFN